MPFRTIPNTTTEYALLSFDADGRERTDDPQGVGGRLSAAILDRARASAPSHIFLFSHGWKGDVASATDQYDRWIKAMLDRGRRPRRHAAAVRADVDRPALAEPAVWRRGAGGHVVRRRRRAIARPDCRDASWSGSGSAPTPSRCCGPSSTRTSAMPPRPSCRPRSRPPTSSWPSASATRPRGPAPRRTPTAAAFDPALVFDEGNALDGGASFGGGGGIIGGLLGPLRQLSYWRMKKRARSIGEGGMHQFVADLMTAAPRARIHLMGHSFGCIVMSSLLGGAKAAKALPRQVDSLALLQGAVSLWAFGEQVHGENAAPATSTRGCGARRCAARSSCRDRSTTRRWAGCIRGPRRCRWPTARLAWTTPIRRCTAPSAPSASAAWTARSPGRCSTPAAPTASRPGRSTTSSRRSSSPRATAPRGAHSDIDGPEVAHALWQAALV